MPQSSLPETTPKQLPARIVKEGTVVEPLRITISVNGMKDFAKALEDVRKTLENAGLRERKTSSGRIVFRKEGATPAVREVMPWEDFSDAIDV